MVHELYYVFRLYGFALTYGVAQEVHLSFVLVGQILRSIENYRVDNDEFRFAMIKGVVVVAKFRSVHVEGVAIGDQVVHTDGMVSGYPVHWNFRAVFS